SRGAYISSISVRLTAGGPYASPNPVRPSSVGISTTSAWRTVCQPFDEPKTSTSGSSWRSTQVRTSRIFIATSNVYNTASAPPGRPRRDRAQGRPRRPPRRRDRAARGACGGSRAVAARCRQRSAEPRDEVRHGPADLVGRVLLDEVRAADRDLLLVREGPAEGAQRPGQEEARVAVDEELRHRALREPVGVRLGDLDHVGGLAVQRDLARPGERGPA